MRKQGSKCTSVYLYAFTGKFDDGPKDHIASNYKFSSPTLDTRKLIKAAIEFVEKRFKEGFLYKC